MDNEDADHLKGTPEIWGLMGATMSSTLSEADYWEMSERQGEGGDPPKEQQPQRIGNKFSLGGMYLHYQVGGGTDYYINAPSIDFSGTTQRQLGLDKIGIGKTLDPVNLFITGINSNSLAFGRLMMTRVSETQFYIAPNMFDFDYQSDASWQRNAGTILGGAVNYNIAPSILLASPIPTLLPYFLGGPYNVIFIGTVTIPK